MRAGGGPGRKKVSMLALKEPSPNQPRYDEDQDDRYYPNPPWEGDPCIQRHLQRLLGVLLQQEDPLQRFTVIGDSVGIT